MKFAQYATSYVNAFLFFLAATIASSGQEPSLQALRPLLRENTLAVAMVDSAKLQSFSASLPSEVQPQFTSLVSSLNGETAYLLIDLPLANMSPSWIELRMAVKQDGKFNPDKLTGHAKRLGLNADKSQAGFIVFDSTLDHFEPGQDQVRSVFSPISDVSFARMEQAMKAVPNTSIKIIGAVPAHVRRTFQELMPQLPNEIGGGTTSVLLDGAIWLAFGIDANQFKLQGHIQSASPEAAQELQKWISNIAPPILAKNPQLKKVLPLATSKVNGTAIEVSANGKDSLTPQLQTATEWLMQYVSPFGLAAKQEKLKKIVLAMFNFESANRVFPPDGSNRNSEGKPRLSWRVHLLPYMEHQIELYKQFHLDEPWDSPHNIKLLPRMPLIYENGAVDEEGKTKDGYTCFLAPSGPGAILASTKVLRLGDISDGTSNTIAVVEVKPENAKPWTAPEDYVYDPKDPASGLAGSGSNGATAVVAICDGSVRMAKIKQDIKNWLNHFQCNDSQLGELE